MAQQIRDRMVSDVVTVEPGTGVVDAAKRMTRRRRDRFRSSKVTASSAWSPTAM
jgi:CBS domain-containing protein